MDKSVILLILLTAIFIPKASCDDDKEPTTKKRTNQTEKLHVHESEPNGDTAINHQKVTRQSSESTGKEEEGAEKSEGAGKEHEKNNTNMTEDECEESQDTGITVAALNWCEVKHPLVITAFIVALVVFMICKRNLESFSNFKLIYFKLKF